MKRAHKDNDLPSVLHHSVTGETPAEEAVLDDGDVKQPAAAGATCLLFLCLWRLPGNSCPIPSPFSLSSLLSPHSSCVKVIPPSLPFSLSPLSTSTFSPLPGEQETCRYVTGSDLRHRPRSTKNCLRVLRFSLQQ